MGSLHWKFQMTSFRMSNKIVAKEYFQNTDNAVTLLLGSSTIVTAELCSMLTTNNEHIVLHLFG
jgi:hypothetical protein